MIIIHCVDSIVPRRLSQLLARAASVLPVVVVTGARQTGKSTLVRELAPDPERLYLTLDDYDLLEQARVNPDDLIARGRRLTIDEVQRAPGLMLAIKRAVDHRREKGRFFLTGSANLLLMKSVGETLAGRASYLTLWPLTRREQLGRGTAGIWDQLIAAPDDSWDEVLSADRGPREDWRALALRGGFPTPALDLESRSDRQLWFSGYVKTYLERDVQEISSISALPDLRRLMRAASLRLGQLVNQTELGRDVSLPQSTVHRYLNLLETSYQMFRLPAFSVNRTSRLIKTPKLYWGDTGLALHISGSEPQGAHLENLILNDLLSWREGRSETAEILYWRTVSGDEVDFVVETEGSVLPIEVKSTTRPRLSDAKGLQRFRAEYPDKSRTALLLHDGEDVAWLGKGILAAPWWRVI